MKYCSCKEPVEIKWIVNGPEEVRQEHEFCCNCMSKVWSEINLKYNSSYAQTSSTFETINQ